MGETCLAHCLAAINGGDQVPSFSLKIGLQLVRWARVAALLAEAFAGCSECLKCLQCARQAAQQPPAAAELLVSPAHADACSKANAPASDSSTPDRCQCHMVAAVTARIQCSAPLTIACSCGLCVSAPPAGGSGRCTSAHRSSCTLASCPHSGWGSPSCKPSGRPRTCGLHCSHQTRTDRPKLGPQAHTTSHNQPLQLPGSLEVGETCLAHCLAAINGGDQVPSFSLKIGLQLVRWARVAALLAEAFAGPLECLECLQYARQAAQQPPAAAELLVNPAHADACSKANAPASDSTTPGRCQCHTVAAVTARIQCSAPLTTACSCGLCVSAPPAGGSGRCTSAHRSSCTLASCSHSGWGSPSCKPIGRPRTCGLHCSHQTRTDRPKLGPQAHTTSHNQPLQLPGSLEVGKTCLAHCLAAIKRGDQVPSFSLKIGLQLVRWARVAALLAEAFAGCSECLECLQCARQAAQQPPAAAELLVSPAHADACSKANAPASDSSTPGRCQCHMVAAVTARIQCSAPVETACSCGLCVSAPQAGGCICLRAPPQRPHQPPKHTAETTSLLSGNSSLHMLWWLSSLWGGAGGSWRCEAVHLHIFICWSPYESLADAGFASASPPHCLGLSGFAHTSARHQLTGLPLSERQSVLGPVFETAAAAHHLISAAAPVDVSPWMALSAALYD